MGMASIIGSGINGNMRWLATLEPFERWAWLLLLEVELMETYMPRTNLNCSKSLWLLLLEVELMETR